MLRFVELRSKMGFYIRVEVDPDSGLYAASDCRSGRVLAVSPDREIALWTAWRDASGFVPFSIVRRHNGRFRFVVASFRPASLAVEQVTFPRWGSARVHYSKGSRHGNV